MGHDECVCGEPKGLHYPDCPLYPKWWRRRDELRAALAERLRASHGRLRTVDELANLLTPTVLSYGEQQRREGWTSGYESAVALLTARVTFRAEAAAGNTDQR